MKDFWESLKALTHARIALGRAGNALPTAEWLMFKMAHSQARDSVWCELDPA
ncbi:ethanolamine ammonia-lyase subunit EutC, partial [bacterium]|nr:ethanolamine ammonia-lyase subunit EutC [bacterium]